MPKRFRKILFVALLFCPLVARAQSAQPAKANGANNQSGAIVDPDELEQHVDGWNRPVPRAPQNSKPSPAGRHDISGTWEPAKGWRNGVQAQGAYNYPMDGKHPLPFTPLGEQMWKTHKYGDGFGNSPVAEVNDPFEMCDPIGFPRIDLHDLRAVQIVQNPQKVLVVYENDQVWRSIWTDGRDFPRLRNHVGTVTRLENGRMIRHWSWKRSGWTNEPGSIMWAVRIPKTCAWRNDSTG